MGDYCYITWVRIPDLLFSRLSLHFLNSVLVSVDGFLVSLDRFFVMLDLLVQMIPHTFQLLLLEIVKILIFNGLLFLAEGSASLTNGSCR